MRSEDLTEVNKIEGHVACMDKMRNADNIFFRISTGNRPIEDNDNDRCIKLKQILQK
jgi:hypothetical protein